MRRKFFGIDLGNKLLKIGVGEEQENGQINLLVKVKKNIESFNDGEIIDSELFQSEIIETIKEIAYQIGESPKEIILTFSSSFFVFQRSKGKISVNDRYISEEDIKRCLSVAKVSLTSGSYEIILEEPIYYFLDGAQTRIRDPLGMEAHNLEVDFFVIQGLKSALNKIKEYFKDNGLNIVTIVPNPFPASYVVLSKRDKEMGAILIDFGYRIFNISVFQNGKLIDYRNFRFGLGDILEDLSLDFGLDVNDFQSIIEDLNSGDLKKKTLKINKKNITYHNFLKSIEKKLSFYWKKNNLNNVIKEIKEQWRLPTGIYLIGGGSFLPEVVNFFKKNSTYAVKIGQDLTQNLSPDERVFFNLLGSFYYFQKIDKGRGFLSDFWLIIKDIFKPFRF